MPSLLVRNATILTMNDTLDVVEGDVLIDDGHIVVVGDVGAVRAERTVDARGGYLLPGFVQTHLHLCQTLFRGYADDLALLDWLTTRIWPMEAAHTPASLQASARLAALELLGSGTTTVLTMETVHDTDAVFDALAPVGLRAIVGKCMMDGDAGVPARLRERTRASIDESLALVSRWQHGANGRLRVAFAPRFAVSCSRELLEEVAWLSSAHGLLVHTHASENRDEVALIQARTGMSNVVYLHDCDLTSERLCLAHCVWVDEVEQNILAERRVNVMHCPGSNLKLGSGLAPIVELKARGVCLSLGADGAACNNHLDMFGEMRLAATLQAVRHGPGALPAADVLRMATRDGARALGMEREIGSVEVGKRADLIVIERDRAHFAPGVDPFSTIVYAGRPTDVRTTIVDGEVLVDDFTAVGLDAEEIAAVARTEAQALAARAF